MEDLFETAPMLGDKFPEMEVNTTHGVKRLPEDYKGRWLVLFSHPGDFTPVCTTEFIAFNKKMNEFKDLNTELLGLSVDQVQSHMKWTEWIRENAKEDIKFPIIADELGLVASKLGMLHPGKGTNTVRAVFIIDPDGIIRLMMYYPQEVGRNVNEVLRSLYALQVSDREGVALPENYPNNEFLGKDKVIIPPASNEDEIKNRKARVLDEEIECLDWWFCFK